MPVETNLIIRLGSDN